MYLTSDLKIQFLKQSRYVVVNFGFGPALDETYVPFAMALTVLDEIAKVLAILYWLQLPEANKTMHVSAVMLGFLDNNRFIIGSTPLSLSYYDDVGIIVTPKISGVRLKK